MDPWGWETQSLPPRNIIASDFVPQCKDFSCTLHSADSSCVSTRSFLSRCSCIWTVIHKTFDCIKFFQLQPLSFCGRCEGLCGLRTRRTVAGRSPAGCVSLVTAVTGSESRVSQCNWPQSPQSAIDAESVFYKCAINTSVCPHLPTTSRLDSPRASPDSQRVRRNKRLHLRICPQSKKNCTYLVTGDYATQTYKSEPSGFLQGIN